MHPRPALACLAILLAACDDGPPAPNGPPAQQQPTAPERAPSLAAEEQAVRDCYIAYKTAILDGDGQAAARHVSASTIAYYKKMLDLVFSASVAETQVLPLLDRMTVVLVRAQVDPELLRVMTGKGLFIHAIQAGMISKNSVIQNEIGKVTVFKNHATGEHITAGKLTPHRWQFSKEDGTWRLELMANMAAMTLGFKQAIKQMGKAENEFILDLVELLTGSKPTAKLWEPLKR